MWIDAALTILGLIMSGFLASMVVQNFLSDSSTLVKSTAGVIVFFVCMMGVRQTLDMVLSEDIDDIMQQDPLFATVKQKYPNKYAVMLSEMERISSIHGDMSPTQIKAVMSSQITPIIDERIAQVSDETRSEFANASIAYFESLNRRDGTLCYDSIFNKVDYNQDTLLTLEYAGEQSNLNHAILTVLEDESRDKAIVASSEVKKVGEKMAQFISGKYKDDLRLMVYPHQAKTKDEKKKVCEITVSTLRYLNDPNDKAKMAALRKLMSGESII